ncbi:MAG: GNAT family N-acetyltransferase [Pseudomonadota bacterium]
MNLQLTTERLILSPFGNGDLDLVVELRTDPAVMRYISETSTPELCAKRMPDFCRRSEDGSMGMWSVRLANTGEAIGTAILLPLPEEAHDTRWDFHENGKRVNEDVEVGYILKPSAWGKGYATEITRRLLQFAFEDTPLTEVVAVTDPDNGASQNVLRKSGLIDTGTRRAYCRDLPGFIITKDQWRAGQAA